MKICVKENNQIHSFDFSKYLYCTSSSIKVSNNFQEYNSILGVYHKDKTSTLGSRSFTISGSFEALNPQDVERFRGEVFSSLFNKPLMLFLDDAAELYYHCVLDGNVTTTYNIGEVISRVFTLSFNLIATKPFSFGEEEIFLITSKEFYFNYDGNVPSFPKVIITFNKSIKIQDTLKPFIQCGNTYIKFNNCKNLSMDKSFYIQNGIVKSLEDESFSSDVLDSQSIFNPLMLVNGNNKITLNLDCFKDSNDLSIYLAFQPIYF